MLACAVKRWEPAQTPFARPALPCPIHQGTRYLVSQMARRHNAVLSSSVRSDRQHSAALRFPKNSPPNALSETLAVLREQMPDSRVDLHPGVFPRQPTRPCSLVASLPPSMCGEAGRKTTKYATLLIRGLAVAARGALCRAALIGRCHNSQRTRQTSQLGSRDVLAEFSACDDHEEGAAGSQRHRTHRNSHSAGSHAHSQALRLPSLVIELKRGYQGSNVMSTALSHHPVRARPTGCSHKEWVYQKKKEAHTRDLCYGIMCHKLSEARQWGVL